MVTSLFLKGLFLNRLKSSGENANEAHMKRFRLVETETKVYNNCGLLDNASF